MTEIMEIRGGTAYFYLLHQTITENGYVYAWKFQGEFVSPRFTSHAEAERWRPTPKHDD